MTIFLSNLNLLLAGWENFNLPPTHRILNLADWLQIFAVSTRWVRRIDIILLINYRVYILTYKDNPHWFLN